MTPNSILPTLFHLCFRGQNAPPETTCFILSYSLVNLKSLGLNINNDVSKISIDREEDKMNNP